MAALKRKAVADDRSVKKVKAANIKEKPKPLATAGREKKRVPSKPQNADDIKPALAPRQSILQQEERAFPRGGGSVLTPLEHKQIQAQAERDALFEEEGGAAKDTDGGLFGEEPDTKPVKKRRKTERPSGEDVKRLEGSGVRIQGLSYKSLAVGSSVLGRISAITGRDIALALPNNLTGYVPITSVSAKLNARIERALAEEKMDIDANEEDDDDIDLKRLFHIGQWLRAIVTTIGTDSTDAGSKGKKHIELSLDPARVNGGLAKDNIIPNLTVQASVRSVEDHGIVVDLGLNDESVKGFIGKKELGTYILDTLQEGQVMLCLVSGKVSNGKVVKLSPDPNKFTLTVPGDRAPVVSDAPSVESFLPGTAVDILVMESSPRGVVGTIMGMLDVTADIVHSEAYSDKDSNKYKVGSKIKGRIIYSLPQDDSSRRIGVSLLKHILALTPPVSRLPANATAQLKTESAGLHHALPLSSIIEEAKVVRVMSDRGLFLELTTQDGPGNKATVAFAHISQVSDSRLDTLSSTSGPYTLKSTHRVRIISYNPVDNIYYVCLKQSILDQSFLRLEDIPIGGMVEGIVERLLLGGKEGVTGVLVKLSDNVTALVPTVHLSDTQLAHPERKYREGFPVKGRVLSVDTEKRHVRLTLKKSLIEADAAVWGNYLDLQAGMESSGTIINLLPNGAVVQFYGSVRAWLPVAEMSETFIETPEQHFRLGQTVRVRILTVNPDAQEMKVTCKEHDTFDPEQQQTWDAITGGKLVDVVVSEKTADSVLVDHNGLKGLIRIGHLVAGSNTKAEKELKRIRVGQKLTNLLVLNKLDRSRTLLLSNHVGMIEDSKAGNLITAFTDVLEGRRVHGFVRNITPEAVYVEFANGIVGLLPKNQVLQEMRETPYFELRKDQTVNVWVTGTNIAQERFVLSMQEHATVNEKSAPSNAQLSNPVDPSIRTMADFTLGKITKARVISAKATQINVQLAEGVQGRIDVSEMFDSWEEIANKAAPLQSFKHGEVIDVKILGIHDARSHRFLPISHRAGKVPVFELSAKKSRIEKENESLLSIDSVAPGSTHLAFINNHGENCVWVSLSPNVRGRIALMDLSDDVSHLQNVEHRFRNGRALEVKVKSVDPSANRLDLSARQDDASGLTHLEDLTSGIVLPARVTKTSERFLTVQISDTIVGIIPLVELSDDYDQANPAQYNKNDIVRVCVLAVDVPNKKVFLSLRPSKVLSSGLPVKDRQINDILQTKPGDIVRGFIKQLTDKGVFVSLGATVDALVRISDLSDQYVKDWRSIFEPNQLVSGRVVAVDAARRQIQLSLKRSHVDGNYKPPLAIADLEEGLIVTGKVRKVEDFGAFIDIDNTQPRLSGLCHRSQVAAHRVEDVRKLYGAGDVVKAIVLNVDVENRKISLGLKASYFKNVDEEEEEEESGNEENESEDAGLEVDGQRGDEQSDASGGVDLDSIQDAESEEDIQEDDMSIDDGPEAKSSGGLKTSGFDWTGDTFYADANGAISESEHETMSTKKRKRNKPAIKEDLTGDLDKYGPRSVGDYERQLLGQPNNSSLWIQYMAFQLELGEVQKARDIAERALRMIHIREMEEKTNIWIAWLNLEVEYGDDDRVDDVFKQACEVQDPLEMHEKLASIYIDSGKHEKADASFERIIGNKQFRASPQVWLNYASFLMDKMQSPVKARALLPRALQSVPTTEHRPLSAKFAGIEFRSQAGDPERGRTIFEGLITEWPKWSSGWDMWVDLERSRIAHIGSEEGKTEAKEKARALFERTIAQKMKKRRAKFVFKKWLEFEVKEGSEKQAERVKALAQEYVEKLASAGNAEDE